MLFNYPNAFFIQRSPKILDAYKKRHSERSPEIFPTVSSTLIYLSVHLYIYMYHMSYNTQPVFVFSITKERNALRLL